MSTPTDKYVPPHRRNQPSTNENDNVGEKGGQQGGGGYKSQNRSGGQGYESPKPSYDSPRQQHRSFNEQPPRNNSFRNNNDGNELRTGSPSLSRNNENVNKSWNSPNTKRWDGGGGDEGRRFGDNKSRSWGESPKSFGGGGSFGGQRSYGGGGRGGFGKRNDQYDENGLMPVNPREERELFSDENSKQDGELLDFDKYEDIPINIEGEDYPESINSFEDIDLGSVIYNSLKLAKFDKPTPIQKCSLPIVMSGRDLMACAQTGSGKTAAYMFPIISHLIANRKEFEGELPSDYNLVFPQALILAPTRELALQIHKFARKFTYRSHLKPVVIYGGAPFGNQARELNYGCNILVATPGRLIDMVQRGKVSLEFVKFLCIDEADRMLDMGFEDQIRKIIYDFKLPDRTERQTLMFSATFPKPIQMLARDFLNNFIYVTIGREGSTTELVTQRLKFVEDDDKRDEVLKLLQEIEGRTLIFVATRKSADMLETFLYQQGFSTASIHGDRTQYERESALDAFKTGKARILVATDVAARGLHIDNVVHVINFDLPSNIDDYVHRIGRTGRCGKVGLATGFFNDSNANIVKELLQLLKETSQEIPDWLYSYGKEFGSSFSKKKKSGFQSNNGRRGFNNYNNNNRSPYSSPRFGGGGGFNNYNNGSFTKSDNEGKSFDRSPKNVYSNFSRSNNNDQWNDDDENKNWW